MQEFVEQCYTNYIKNAGIQDNIFPKLKPIIINATNNEKQISYAYINSNNILDSTVNLYIHPQFFLYTKQFQESKLYHEFTHILDAITLFKNYSESDRRILLSIYSEYHASQIELIYAIGFKSFYPDKKIDLSKTLIPYKNTTCSVEKEYLRPLNDALNIIQQDNDFYYNINVVEYYQNYTIFESNLMYYLGKKNLCVEISIENILFITNILERLFGEFLPIIRNIENNIKLKNFNTLIQLRNELFNKYITYFKFGNIELLLNVLNTL